MDGEMEQPLEQPSSELSIEVGSSHPGNGSAEENPAPDLAKSESDRIQTFYQTVLSVIMVFIVAALSGYQDMKPLYSTTSDNKSHLSNLLVAEGLVQVSHRPRWGHGHDANRGQHDPRHRHQQKQHGALSDSRAGPGACLWPCVPEHGWRSNPA